MCCHDHQGSFRGPRWHEGSCCHEHDDHHECCCGPNCDCGPDCRCGCRGPGEGRFGFRRHFRSKAEMIAALEAYLKELENEVQGVREAIEELKA